MREAYIEFKNDVQTDGWYEISELTYGYITFLTSSNNNKSKNKITIPMVDIKRVKERGVHSE